ncbi:hypothetical protein Hdeb2414_s0009g00323191 [Helianthus debilis subsp. tardiflorus]
MKQNTYLFVYEISTKRSASKSTSKFGLDDIDIMISPRSIKKELAKGQNLHEPKVVTTRANVGSKRKKPVEPEEDAFEVERQFHEFVTERFVRLKAHHEKNLAEMEDNLASLRSIAAAKDKTISKMEKDMKGLEKQLLVAEMQANKAEIEVTDETKVCVACAIPRVRIKMTQEVVELTLTGQPGMWPHGNRPLCSWVERWSRSR